MLAGALEAPWGRAWMSESIPKIGVEIRGFDAPLALVDHRNTSHEHQVKTSNKDEKEMKYSKLLLTAILAYGLVAIGCGDDSSAPSNNSNNVDSRVQAVATLDGDADTGKPQFDSICVTCHAMDGTGVDGLGNDLTASTLGREEVIDTIINGRGTMVGYDTALTDQEVADIAAYALQFQQ